MAFDNRLGFGVVRWMGRRALCLLALMCCAAVACAPVAERRAATLERAEAVLALGDVERAVAVLESFRDFDPRDLEVSVRLAEIQLEQNRGCDALGLLDALPATAISASEAQEPASAESLGVRRRIALARALLACGSARRAVPIMMSLHAGGWAPDDAVERLVLRLSESSSGFEGDLPEAWRVRLTEVQIQRGFLPAALLGRDRLIGTHPARRMLLEKILQAGVNSGKTQFLHTLEEKGRAPETPWKLLARHHVLVERGFEDEATAVERRFLERFSQHPRRFDMLLAVARREVRSGRPEHGLVLARQASALRPTRPEPLVEQALALDALGQRAEAERALGAVLGMDPNHGAALRLTRQWSRQGATSDPGQGGLARLELTFDGARDN